MKCTAAFLIFGIFLTGFANRRQPAVPESSAAKLVGTWKITSFEDRPAKGPIIYPYGKTPIGLLIYDSTGHMSIQIMKLPHPKVASGDEEQITNEEKLALFGAYEAYFGTYEVDWERHVVTHNVQGHLKDVYADTPQERPFELNGDHLSLTPRWESNDGQKMQGVRTFERVH